MGDAVYEPEADGKWKAVVAEFRNEPGEFALVTWYEVRASITYYDEHGTERAHVGGASWLEAVKPTIDLPRLVVRKFLVVVQGSDAWVSFDTDGVVVIPEDVRRAKITLHDPREFTASYTLDFDLTSGTVGTLVPLSAPR